MKLKPGLLFLLLALNLVAVFGQASKSFRMCFDINASDLPNAYSNEIDTIALLLQEPNFSFLKIFGYATPSGSEEYNIELSQKRVFDVYNKINKIHAIDQTKFYMIWLGEDSETYDLHYENAQPQTPCVEIIMQFEQINGS